jgi:hypothetical protein
MRALASSVSGVGDGNLGVPPSRQGARHKRGLVDHFTLSDHHNLGELPGLVDHPYLANFDIHFYPTFRFTFLVQRGRNNDSFRHRAVSVRRSI